MAEVRTTVFDSNNILETIVEGVVTIDEQGMIRSMNPAAEKMFGYKNNELFGQKFTNLAPKLYLNEERPVACNWERLTKQTGRKALGLGRTRCRAIFPIEISLGEMIVNQQKFYVTTIRHTSERKIEDNGFFAATLRAIPEGIIATDVDGTIIMMNKPAEALTGWSCRDAIGQQLNSVFKIAEDLTANVRPQKNPYRNEVDSVLRKMPQRAILSSRDGIDHIIEQVASPIRDHKDEVLGVVWVFRDVTERERDEAERRKAESTEHLGLLAGGIAHDFLNLLTPIIGNISLASLLVPPENEIVIRLNHAKKGSLRARDLAQQLLTFARGGAPIKKVASLGKLIQDTVSFSLRGSHSRSEFVIGEDVWPAQIDPLQISQVIGNLVVNADQAMPNGGTLWVSCDNFSYRANTVVVVPDLPSGDYVRIAIRDEGVGISENIRKRIFDPYFTTKPRGTGLGLATAYSIVKNHKGLICLESQLHVGSTFTVYLPASRPQEMAVDSGIPIIKPANRELLKLDILAVDDEENILELIEFYVSRWCPHLRLATARDASEAFAKLMTARPALLFTDIVMPGGDSGTDLIEKVRQLQEFNEMKIVISTGYPSHHKGLELVERGFADIYLAKPWEYRDLHEVFKSTGLVDTPLPSFSS